MKSKRSIRAHLAYARYLAKHKWFVFVACRKLGVSVWRGIAHDASKVLPSEWGPYLRTFYREDGTKQNEPQPNQPDFDLAWLLHQRRNPHHWQAWLLRKDDGSQKPLEMPEVFVREMVADWVGAGMAIKGRTDPRPWYEENKHHIHLHPKTRELAEKLMTELAGDSKIPNGEDDWYEKFRISYDGFFVVRTCSAGVHVGRIVRREGKEVELSDARRIWSWAGARTLHELSQQGVQSAEHQDFDPSEDRCSHRSDRDHPVHSPSR